MTSSMKCEAHAEKTTTDDDLEGHATCAHGAGPGIECLQCMAATDGSGRVIQALNPRLAKPVKTDDTQARPEAWADSYPRIGYWDKNDAVEGYMAGQREAEQAAEAGVSDCLKTWTKMHEEEKQASAEEIARLTAKIDMMEVGVAAGDDVTNIAWCEDCQRYMDVRIGCLADLEHERQTSAEEIERLKTALRAIDICESRYRADPLERAHEAVDHCQRTAREALRRPSGPQIDAGR